MEAIAAFCFRISFSSFSASSTYLPKVSKDVAAQAQVMIRIHQGEIVERREQDA